MATQDQFGSLTRFILAGFVVLDLVLLEDIFVNEGERAPVTGPGEVFELMFPNMVVEEVGVGVYFPSVLADGDAAQAEGALQLLAVAVHVVEVVDDGPLLAAAVVAHAAAVRHLHLHVATVHVRDQRLPVAELHFADEARGPRVQVTMDLTSHPINAYLSSKLASTIYRH